ncbi:MAG: hypothetical protein ABI536_04805 [Gallionella sp.]
MAIWLAAGWLLVFDPLVFDPQLLSWEATGFGMFEPAAQAASARLCVRSLAAAKSKQ